MVKLATLVLAVATAAAGLAGCASETPSGGGGKAGGNFSQRGPYEVGVTTLKLPDRSVEVYYPADPASAKALPLATYKQTDPIPPAMLGMLPKMPANVDLNVTLPAKRDAQGAKSGGFPMVVFSHGAGGWRGGQGNMLAGLASWGFVVASTDYLEYGFVSQFTGGARDLGARRQFSTATVTATIDLINQAAKTDGSVLKNLVDGKRIGAIGHSAGGGTMFAELNDPRIGVIIGWAPVPPQPPITSHTPTMIIAGRKDIAISPAVVTTAYETLQAPKRLVIIDNMGHNAFTDTCLSIRGGNDLIGLAKQLGLGIPEGLLNLARNGCEAPDMDTRQGWAIIQHFTVAELRTALGVDRSPRGLGPKSPGLFAGATISYREDLSPSKRE